MRRQHITGVAAALALAATTSLPMVASAGSGSVPTYQHIFVIVMENHSYGQIIGNAAAPHINALAQTYGLATNYFGVTHPSEPNYVATIGGSFFGIQDDAAFSTTAQQDPTNPVNHTITAPSLADQLEAQGLTWKTYQQSLPSAGYMGTRWPLAGPTLYASKHNPFVNFAGVQNNPAAQQNIVPDTQLTTDLQSGQAPNFSYIVPDQCNDMHGTTGCSGDSTLIPAGDQYVANTVSAITASSAWQRGNNAIVVVWDENDFSVDNPNGCCDADGTHANDGGGGGHVAAIVITNNGPRGLQDPTPYNHYSLLQTIQRAFHLGCLQNTCDTANVTPMARLFGGDS